MDQSPNLGSAWLAEPRTLHFNFVHRFTTSPAPQRKISNSPTFVLAARTQFRTMVGAAYATNSDVVPGIPNEWELFGRIVPELGGGDRRSQALQLGWNLAARSLDGQAAWAQSLGPVRVLGTVRAFSNAFDAGEPRLAAGGGVSFRLKPWLALAGDGVTLVHRTAGERIAWSGGVQMGIPGTPHALSVHATNTNTTTMEGLSRGTPTVRYGFEYTIPIHLARFRRPSAPPQPEAVSRVAAAPSRAAATWRPDSVRVSIRNLAYSQVRLEVAPGTVVVWTNEDPIVHTVTSDDASFDSGDIAPRQTWARSFEEAGVFAMHCTPHPFMRATIIVREP
jgi:plastocyanin